MKKKHFYIIKIKQLILPLILIMFTGCLVIFSNSNLSAAKSGLILWSNSIVPVLFPFFVATELLSHTNFAYFLGAILNRFMKPIFNVRGEGSFAFIMGIISGYPIGAKIATTFRENNICTKEECERLLSFTNNSGPLFIIGTVGISMFGNSTIGFLLLITHLLASITVGIVFRFWKYGTESSSVQNSSYANSKNTISLSNLGGIIGNSISSSINTILLIGGFVVLFSVIISILQTSQLLNVLSACTKPLFSLLNIPINFSNGLISGILELTNGLNIVCNIPTKKLSINIIIASFLLGLGGISILLQVWSTIAKTDLSIKPYILGKLLHATFSAIYTFLLLNSFSFFNFDL